MKRIVFLTPYPIAHSPSQRFRFEQYLNLLRNQGYTLTLFPFLSEKGWVSLYKPGRPDIKVFYFFVGFLKRTTHLVTAILADYVFIHREATPLGPPIMEWLLAKIFRKKIIYDFDDAIWLTDRKHESFLLEMLKWRSKVKSICKWSYKVSCGNQYLSDFASQFNTRVIYNPTTIDTSNWHNPKLYVTNKSENKVVIGWTGSHSTLKYLGEVERALHQIENNYDNVEIIVIADCPPDLRLPKLRFIPWRIETEVQDLINIDIGIMPLPNDKWAKGKCGFKALQYMALEIPAVVSPVGVNTTIVEHGVTGYLANSEDEWYSYITALIDDKWLRKKMGASGRQKAINHYSVDSNSANFLSLFE